MDDGKLQGTMYGVVKAPDGHRHKHKHCSHWHKLAKLMKSVAAASRGYLFRAELLVAQQAWLWRSRCA